MKKISTSSLSINDIPQAKLNNWAKISIFSLTIPQEELAAQTEHLQSLINSDIDISRFSTSVIRAKLYSTQRIINNQEGCPDSKAMTKIVEAIEILRTRYK